METFREMERFDVVGNGHRVTVVRLQKEKTWADSDSEGFDRRSISILHRTTTGEVVYRVDKSERYEVPDVGILCREWPILFGRGRAT